MPLYTFPAIQELLRFLKANDKRSATIPIFRFPEKSSLAGIAEAAKVSRSSESSVTKPKSLSLDLEQPGSRPRSSTSESPMTPTDALRR